MLLYIVDATDRSRRDAAKDMLFGELRHRMKNLLAVAQSIARQTTTKGRSAEEENRVESGWPSVAPPATTGYGTQLIQSATTHSLGGQVEQKFAAGGLETEIVIPLESASPGLKAVHAEDRVIVEDEFLIALDLQLVLEHHGWRVMEPVATVRDAC